MIELKKFRNLNITEKKIIDTFILQNAPKLYSILKEIKCLFYILFNNSNSNNKFPSIYILSNSLIDTLNSIKSADINIISSGLYFGFIKKSKFYLSIEGAEFIYKKNCFSKHHYIRVNDQGEKSILYGNNIKKYMIKEISNKLSNNDIKIILNSSNELLAIAQSQVNNSQYQNLKASNLVAFNLIDKGYYLRIKQ